MIQKDGNIHTIQKDGNIHTIQKDRNFQMIQKDGKLLIFDVNSCHVLTVNRSGWDIINALQSHDPKKELEVLHDKYNHADIGDFIEKLRVLKENGVLSTSDPSEIDLPINPPVTFLRVHVADSCNLNCTYCYSDVGSPSKGKGLMNEETIEQAIEFFIKSSGNEQRLSIDFYGGEPLLNVPVIKHGVAYAKARGSEAGKDFRFFLFTNGSLLTDDVILFLKENEFNVAISMDGPASVQNEQRPTPDGKGSYDIVRANAKKLIKSLPSENIIARATLTQRNHDISSIVMHLSELGFQYISVQECNLPEEHEYAIGMKDVPGILTEYDGFLEQWGTMIASAFGHPEKWRHQEKPITFLPVTNTFSRLHTPAPSLVHCNAGHSLLAVSSSGDIYPCHEFVGLDDYKLGTVSDHNVDENDTMKSNTRKAFIESIRIRDKPACGKCRAKYLCGGGCPAHAVKYSRNIHVPYGVGCELTRHRMHHAIQMYFRFSRDHPRVLHHFLKQRGPGDQPDVGITKRGQQEPRDQPDVGLTKWGQKEPGDQPDVGITKWGQQEPRDQPDVGLTKWGQQEPREQSEVGNDEVEAKR